MAIQQRASTLATRLQSILDRLVSPQARSQVYSSVSSFAHEQPLLASFVALQLLFSATPLFLFTSFAAGVLLVALVAALLFSLFWVGLALLVLAPTLFVTVGLGIGVWVWALTSFVVLRWVYGLLPVSVTGRVQVDGVNGAGDAGKKVVVVEKRGGLGM